MMREMRSCGLRACELILKAFADNGLDNIDRKHHTCLANASYKDLHWIFDRLSYDQIETLVFIFTRLQWRPDWKLNGYKKGLTPDLIEYLFIKDQRLGRIVKGCADELVGCDPPDWERWQEVKALLLRLNP